MSQYYTIINQRQIASRHGGTVTEITLVGVKDRILYRTYIDTYNRNYAVWSEIIHNPLQGYLLGGLKVKSTTKALINADSPVEILYTTEDPDEIYNELLSVWQRTDQVNTFGILFS